MLEFRYYSSVLQVQTNSREGNRLTHALAKRVVLSSDTDVWVESLSNDLDVVLQSDLDQ